MFEILTEFARTKGVRHIFYSSQLSWKLEVSPPTKMSITRFKKETLIVMNDVSYIQAFVSRTADSRIQLVVKNENKSIIAFECLPLSGN